MGYEDQLYVWCLLLRNKLAGKIAPAHPKDNRALEYAARRLANAAEMIPQHNSALMAVNKVARTFRGAGRGPEKAPRRWRAANPGRARHRQRWRASSRRYYSSARGWGWSKNRTATS